MTDPREIARSLAIIAANYFDQGDDEEFIGNFTKDLDAAITAVVGQERERCAKVAEENKQRASVVLDFGIGWNEAVKAIATAIRGDKK